MLKISDFYLDKQKFFVPKKILSVTCTMESFFSANRWRLDVLTFLVKGFAFYYRHPSLPQKIPFLSQTWSKIHTLVYYIQSWYFQALFFWLGTGYWKESWLEIFLIFKSLVFSRSLSDDWRFIQSSICWKKKFVMQSKQIVSLNYLHQLWIPYFKHSNFSNI